MAISRKSKTLCIDKRGGEHLRHLWDGSGYCARCAVLRPEWDKTRARRRAGERLVGYRGAIGELTNTARGAGGSEMKHAETWNHIVAACKSETQASINVGGNRRRAAIVEADERYEALVAMLRDEAVAILMAHLYHDMTHEAEDEAIRDECEARLDGINTYRARLLAKIDEDKETP